MPIKRPFNATNVFNYKGDFAQHKFVTLWKVRTAAVINFLSQNHHSSESFTIVAIFSRLLTKSLTFWIFNFTSNKEKHVRFLNKCCYREQIMNSRNPRVDCIELENSKVHLSSMKFDDHIMLGVSDRGVFGSFYRVFKSNNQHKNKEPVFEIVPIFGCDDQYFQVSFSIYRRMTITYCL